MFGLGVRESLARRCTRVVRSTEVVSSAVLGKSGKSNDSRDRPVSVGLMHLEWTDSRSCLGWVHAHPNGVRWTWYFRPIG